MIQKDSLLSVDETEKILLHQCSSEQMAHLNDILKEKITFSGQRFDELHNPVSFHVVNVRK